MSQPNPRNLPRNFRGPRQCHAWAQWAKAEAALAANQAEQALRHVQEAVRYLPDEPQVRLICAKALLQLHEYREACNALDAHDHLCPEDRNEPRVLRLRIDALAGLGLNRLALKAAERLARAVPYDVEAHRVMAALSEVMQERDKAITAWRNVVKHAPHYPGARRRLASLIAQDHPAEAFDLLDEQTDRITRADLARRAQRLADAEHEYAMLLEEAASPPLPEVASPPEEALLSAAEPASTCATAWLDAGRVACDRGELDLAERRLRHAAASPGSAGEALRCLAVTRMRRGAFASAGYAWWKLARRTDNAGELNAWAWAGLAMCAMLAKRPTLLRRAERELSVHTSRAERRAVMAELWPDAAGALAACDRVEHRQADTGTADTRPWHPSLTRSQAETLSDHPQRSPLTALLRAASHTLGHEAREHPERADVQYHLAVCDAALGETSIARQAVGHALQINPTYAAAQALAARLDREQRHAA